MFCRSCGKYSPEHSQLDNLWSSKGLKKHQEKKTFQQAYWLLHRRLRERNHYFIYLFFLKLPFSLLLQKDRRPFSSISKPLAFRTRRAPSTVLCLSLDGLVESAPDSSTRRETRFFPLSSRATANRRCPFRIGVTKRSEREVSVGLRTAPLGNSHADEATQSGEERG